MHLIIIITISIVNYSNTTHTSVHKDAGISLLLLSVQRHRTFCRNYSCKLNGEYIWCVRIWAHNLHSRHYIVCYLYCRGKKREKKNRFVVVVCTRHYAWTEYTSYMYIVQWTDLCRCVTVIFNGVHIANTTHANV